MVSFPKKPNTKQPANDPMLDAIRSGGDEPHFGASPEAVQAANNMLMAKLRNSLPGAGRSPAPALATPSPDRPAPLPEAKADETPTADAQTPDAQTAQAERNALEQADLEQAEISSPASAEEAPPGMSFEALAEEPVSDPVVTPSPEPAETAAAPAIAEEETSAATEAAPAPLPDETAHAAQESVAQEAADAPDMDAASTPASDVPPAIAIRKFAGPAFETKEADLPSTPLPEALEPNGVAEPAYRPDLPEPDFEEEEDFAPIQRVSPAAARESVAVPFDAVATTSERASRAFPVLEESEFRTLADAPEPEEAARKEWQGTQSASQRKRWTWALAGLLVAGVAINAFFLTQTDTETRSVTPPRLPAATTAPQQRVPIEAAAPPAMPAPSVLQAPALPEAPAPLAAPVAPAVTAPPVAAPRAQVAPQAPKALPMVDPRRILTILSRP